MAKFGTIAFLLFEGFEVLDVYGPLEMFGTLKVSVSPDCINIITVAEHKGPVKSSQGPSTLADYDFTDCPPLDALLVPGGIGTRTVVNSAPLLEFLRKVDQQAGLKYMLSVCTGAALLAAAGLLDNKAATTNKLSFKFPVSHGPSTRWVKDARWVEDGRTWTSAGVSAGMDMALALISKEYGESIAKDVARRAEYAGSFDYSLNDPFGPLITLD